MKSLLAESVGEAPPLHTENIREEEVFLKKVKEYVSENISDNQLKTDQIADNMNCSSVTLNRKLKSKIGVTGSAYIKELRLSKAHTYFISKSYETVSEVSMAVGFTRANYFAKEFYKRYGKKPGDFF